jgi:hypothetical protein
MPIELGIHNFFGGPNHPPHKPMCEYLSIDRSKAKGISVVHFCAGRGSNKTTGGIVFAGDIVFNKMPGRKILWTESRHEDLFDTFLENWAIVFPEEHGLWRFDRDKMTIRCSNGSRIKLKARSVDNPRKRVGHGPTYAGIIHDEISDKFDMKTYSDFKASIRDPGAPFLFLETLSTPNPLSGEYDNLLEAEGATVIRASSYDSPFISKEAIDEFKREMSHEYAASQIYGKSVPLEGRVWKHFSDEPWPKGNIHHTASWDPQRPWYLGMDLGGNLGHWQIWQYFEPIHKGQRIQAGNVAVVVAEGLQQSEAIYPVLTRIRSMYANKYRPVHVAIGHDVKSGGSSGVAAEPFIIQIGWEQQIPSGVFFEKSTQHLALASLILNTAGERRFCVSNDIARHGPARTNWGVLHCMHKDTYPEPGSKERFRKDKKTQGSAAVEDARDSTMYLAVINHPPEWTPHTKWAM